MWNIKEVPSMSVAIPKPQVSPNSGQDGDVFADPQDYGHILRLGTG